MQDVSLETADLDGITAYIAAYGPKLSRHLVKSASPTIRTVPVQRTPW